MAPGVVGEKSPLHSQTWLEGSFFWGLRGRRPSVLPKGSVVRFSEQKPITWGPPFDGEYKGALLEAVMDDAQLQIILQSMGTPLLKVSEATSNLLEQNASRLAADAVSEQRGRAEERHLVSLSLKSMLLSIGSNL
jgi:hypothetical protein